MLQGAKVRCLRSILACSTLQHQLAPQDVERTNGCSASHMSRICEKFGGWLVADSEQVGLHPIGGHGKGGLEAEAPE